MKIRGRYKNLSFLCHSFTFLSYFSCQNIVPYCNSFVINSSSSSSLQLQQQLVKSFERSSRYLLLSASSPESSSTSDDQGPGESESESEENEDDKALNNEETKKEVVGIGGKDGLVYNVNKLKRNLVQETIRAYKGELLELLGFPPTLNDLVLSTSTTMKKIPLTQYFQDNPYLYYCATLDLFITEKLVALLQANPGVSTTTDSNLLEGQWTFAYASETARQIMDQDQFDTYSYFNSKRNTNNKSNDNENGKNSGESSITTTTNYPSVTVGPWKIGHKKRESPFRVSKRCFHLEELDDDEDAHIVDITRFLGRAVQVTKRYDIINLSRTSLNVMNSLTSNLQITFFNKHSINIKTSTRKKNREMKSQNNQHQPLFEIQILYLDSDLCICTTDKGLNGPLLLYTKSEIWKGKKERRRRKKRYILTFLTLTRSPLQLRKRIKNFFSKSKDDEQRQSSINNGINGQTQQNNNPVRIETTDISVLKIGEVENTEGKFDQDSDAWGVDEDPFYYLDDDEQQKRLKQMSIKQIEKLGLQYQIKSSKKREQKYKQGKFLKRPPPKKE